MLFVASRESERENAIWGMWRISNEKLILERLHSDKLMPHPSSYSYEICARKIAVRWKILIEWNWLDFKGGTRLELMVIVLRLIDGDL